MTIVRDRENNNDIRIHFRFDDRMNIFLIHKKMIAVICFMALIMAANSWAQQRALRGGSAVFSNGSNTITLAPPASLLTNYSLTLPPAQSAASSIQWLANNGSGVLSWVTSPGGLNAVAVGFSVGFPQQTATSPNYLFNLQSLKTGAGSNSVNSLTPGAYINSTVNGTSANATGLTINVSNTLASATAVTLTGLSLHSGSTVAPGSIKSNNYGLSVNVSGGGTNYAALFTAGNVGFGTSSPSEILEVNGNIRISGTNGLKISEGTNATMGKATLAVGGGISTVVVNTTKVTANSRIFLMSQNGVAATVGTPYVTARTAGTSFTIQSTSNTDVSDVAWWMVEP